MYLVPRHLVLQSFCCSGAIACSKASVKHLLPEQTGNLIIINYRTTTILMSGVLCGVAGQHCWRLVGILVVGAELVSCVLVNGFTQIVGCKAIGLIFC